MTTGAKLEEVKKYLLEDWVKIFGEIYKNADSNRNAYSLWLDVIDESATLAGYIRRDEYQRAIDTIPDVFSRLMSFIAKYSINLTDAVLQEEGIDLRPTSGNLHLTEWIMEKYPEICSTCAHKPCVCHSLRHERSTRLKDFKFAEIININLMKQASWERTISGRIEEFNVESIFNMFNEIYYGVHHNPPISSLCFHLLEEVGEVANVLLSYTSIKQTKFNSNDALKKNLRYLNGLLKGDISDVVSWTMAIINKVNCLIRATHPYSSLANDLENNNAVSYKQFTLSELLLNRCYDPHIEKFVCHYCKSERCSPKCKQNRLVEEIENRVRREDDLMYEMRRATGQERRKCVRKSTDDKIRLGDDDIYIVNISENNMGFLSNTMLSLNEEKEIIIRQENMEECIKIKITRPARADTKTTGFQYFHGAEILGREKRPKRSSPPPSPQRPAKRPARSTSA